MDEKRIFAKCDELDSYLEELEKIKPSEYEEYKRSIEKKRACERLLQISIETVIDICNILVSDLRLGLPSEEEDLFIKLVNKKIISNDMAKILIKMKGLRNLLVHKYGVIDDEEIFEILTEKLGDFDSFKEEVLGIVKKENKKKH